MPQHAAGELDVTRVCGLQVHGLQSPASEFRVWYAEQHPCPLACGMAAPTLSLWAPRCTSMPCACCRGTWHGTHQCRRVWFREAVEPRQKLPTARRHVERDRNSFQPAKDATRLDLTVCVIAPSARILVLCAPDPFMLGAVPNSRRWWV